MPLKSRRRPRAPAEPEPHADHFHHLPDWHKDNEFVVRAYRPVKPCVRTSLRSAFALHNESANVWTHALGFVLFGLLGYWCLTHHLPAGRGGWRDALSFASFFLGALFCMGASTAFHLFMSHSHRLFRVFSKLDYLGIVVVMAGGHATLMDYLFWCAQPLRWAYTGFMAVTSTVVGVLVLRDEFAEPQWRNARGVAFGTLMCSALLPIAHSWTLEPHSPQEDSVLFHVLLMLGVELTGGVIFVSRVPERWKPGAFDLFHSHALFHCFVVAGIVVFYWGLLVAFEHRWSISCSAVP